MFIQKLKELYREFSGAGQNDIAYLRAGWWGVLCLVLIVSGIAGYHYLTGLPRIVMMLLGIAIGALSFFVFRLLWWLLYKLIQHIPPFGFALVMGGISALFYMRSQGFRWPDSIFEPAAILSTVGVISLFGCLVKLVKGDVKSNSGKLLLGLGVVIPIALGGIGLYQLIQQGNDPYEEELAQWKEANPHHISKDNPLNGLESPSETGSFKVTTFTYGNGTDNKRKEYSSEVRFKTASVDASYMLPDWKGKKKKWREKYWGFGIKELPLNGRVYMPEGEGPFPLFLIVHGNHSMIDYSDDGYGYLGELLASRGIIAVSLDQNFINGHWSGDFRGEGNAHPCLVNAQTY